jgi:hypothetical protein
MISIKRSAEEKLRSLAYTAGLEVAHWINHCEEAYYQETIADELGKN